MRSSVLLVLLAVALIAAASLRAQVPSSPLGRVIVVENAVSIPAADGVLSAAYARPEAAESAPAVLLLLPDETPGPSARDRARTFAMYGFATLAVRMRDSGTTSTVEARRERLARAHDAYDSLVNDRHTRDQLCGVIGVGPAAAQAAYDLAASQPNVAALVLAGTADIDGASLARVKASLLIVNAAGEDLSPMAPLFKAHGMRVERVTAERSRGELFTRPTEGARAERRVLEFLGEKLGLFSLYPDDEDPDDP